MRTLVTLAIGLVVVGCGGSPDEETLGKEIADDYKEAMDKAREVEKELQKHVEDIEEVVDEAMDEVEDAIEEQRDP